MPHPLSPEGAVGPHLNDPLSCLPYDVLYLLVCGEVLGQLVAVVARGVVSSIEEQFTNQVRAIPAGSVVKGRVPSIISNGDISTMLYIETFFIPLP